ncbi:partition protein B [Burkholderia gladioli]|uniref:Partition protein B n=1 Tax=Burkholderia gladioli TaxID=28095 RepID=A0A2A7SAL1_BURGA|nr:ParB/RepB/Spo0J family partition protein [Burkholderia gladioli]PEH40483.1 partition protein B [Burkholderia gladioli]
MAGVFGKSIAKASTIQASLKAANSDVLAHFIDTAKMRCGPQTRKPDNPGFSPESIKELSDSIVATRQTDPIIVRPDPEKISEYLVVAGERRYRACKLAGKPVLAFVWELNDEQHRAIQIAENLHREDLTAREIAHELQTDYEKFGTYEKVAVHWGKSLNWVHERVKFLDAVSVKGAAQLAVKAGLTADVSTVNNIARLDKADPGAALALVKSAAENPGMNLRTATRDALKETKAAKKEARAAESENTRKTPRKGEAALVPRIAGTVEQQADGGEDQGGGQVQQSILTGLTYDETVPPSNPVPPEPRSMRPEPTANEAQGAKPTLRLMNLTQFAAAWNEAGGGLVRYESEEWIAACKAGELEDSFGNLETLLARLALAGVPRIEVEFGGLAL